VEVVDTRRVGRRQRAEATGGHVGQTAERSIRAAAVGPSNGPLIPAFLSSLRGLSLDGVGVAEVAFVCETPTRIRELRINQDSHVLSFGGLCA
jgi:hypothetical protein